MGAEGAYSGRCMASAKPPDSTSRPRSAVTPVPTPRRATSAVPASKQKPTSVPATTSASEAPLPGEVLTRSLALPSDSPWARVLHALAADRAPTTIRAYASDLRALQAYRMGLTTSVPATPPPHPSTLLAWLCDDGRHAAVERVLAWVAAMQDAAVSQATIARRIAALRACVDVAQRLGICDWTLDVSVTTPKPYRDTRGPGTDGVTRLLAAAAAQDSPTRERDGALIWCMFGRGLRRAEVAGLDLDDLDLAHARLHILGKHRREREWLTIPEQTCAALHAWLALRGSSAGPLFWALDRAAFGKRLTPGGIAYITHRLGAIAGLAAHQARPHGLRHAAITAGLDATGGDTRAVQSFARLADANTIRHYDDSRVDLAGQVAGKIADALQP